MLKTFNVVLDIEKELYNPAIMSFSISQADLSIVELTMTIRQDDSIFDLSEATSVQLGIKKPSGLVVYQDCEITDPARGEVKATLTNQAYIEWGIYTAEIYIKDYNTLTDQDQIAVTCPFFYYSRSAVMSDEALESFNDWTALQDLLLTYDKKPILIEGIPTVDPEYVGQMAFDTIGRRAFIAGGLTADLWQVIGAGEGGGGGVVSWADIIGKPATFPASPHRHPWSDLDNIPTTFQPVPHTHFWADITDKPETFAPSAHTHTISDITDLQGTLDGKADDADLIPFITELEADGKYAFKGEIGSSDWADITNKPTTFPPSAHIHTIAEITDLQAELDSKIESIPTEYLTESEGDLRYAFKGEGGTGGGSVLVEDVLTSTSTTSALSANQGRILNNSKAPLTHTHLWADITDKPTTFTPSAHTHAWTEVTGKPTTFTPSAHTHLWADITDKPATFAPSAHIHTIGDVTNLQTTLNGKSDVGHTHAWTDITAKPTTFAPSAHTHLWADITDKPTEFKPQIMTGAQRGGAMIGNGLAMSGEYLLVKTLTSSGTKIDTVNNAVVIDRSAVDLWYAPKAHTHLWADITDKPVTFAPSAHTHAISEVNGLQNALDGKVDDAQMNGLTLWKGTQADYDVLTPDPNTLYFISG